QPVTEVAQVVVDADHRDLMAVFDQRVRDLVLHLGLDVALVLDLLRHLLEVALGRPLVGRVEDNRDPHDSAHTLARNGERCGPLAGYDARVASHFDYREIWNRGSIAGPDLSDPELARDLVARSK